MENIIVQAFFFFPRKIDRIFSIATSQKHVQQSGFNGTDEGRRR